MRKNRVLLGGLALTLSVVLTACASANGKSSDSSSSSSTDKISLMQDTDLLSLDNSNYADLTMWNVLENSMEGLYRQDSSNKVAPGMAESVVKPTNNGKTYTFHLRPNAKWSNGDAVTATDFVKSWQRSVSAKSKSGYNYIFSGIKNADQISNGKMAPTQLGAKAVNAHTLQVNLEHPMPYFSKMMILPAFFPQDTKVVQKYGSKYGTNSNRVVSDGPFKVTGWTGTNDNWKLLRNPHYYDQKAVHLKEIDMQVVKDANTAHNLFAKGQLDDATISGVTAQGLQKNKDLRHVQKAGTYYVRLNNKAGKPFNNQKLRQAVSLAVDRNHLTKDVLADGSKPAYTYVAQGLATDPTTGKDFATEMTPTETHNVAKAKQLWSQGLKEANLKGTVNLTLVGDDDTVTKNVAQYLQGTLQQNLGNVKVNMQNLPTKTVSNKEAGGQFDFDQTLWLADFGDPENFFSILTKDNPQNYAHYEDPQFNAAMKDATTSNAANTGAYWKDMRTAQSRLNATMPVVPLYSMVESHLVNPKLKGIEYHPVGENDYTRAYLEK
ncbi:peptide ABC transporter substrate-binding protein [Secundilactobacillus hailunensis]|uniref:Peptide ABC transporter substrate-binding protein n=1 Tax=Secundilactobacillus hailunensis TaxID=2559923 RepID=A0ABW1T7A5_9LACO|nr:peptide ABC transporter substrate-binding protein [Secundilactobacillus hailunensis]